MVKYYYKDKTFVLEDYQNAKTFSSFLPAIAGEDGRPLWAFFANVGQCLGGFGVNNRETPITPFDSATLAYQNIPLKSFRTFIKVDNQIFSPFFQPQVTQTMFINQANFSIVETSPYFTIKITYSSVPHASYSALIRKVEITNITDVSRNYVFVDGLPIIFPYGLSNNVYKELVSLMAAYCEVHNMDQRAPFIKFKTSTSDNPMVSLIENGNGYLSFDQNGQRLANIVDIRNVFGHNLALLHPDQFQNLTYADFAQQPQQIENKMPCAFSHNEIMLAPGATYTFYSLFGSFDSLSAFNDVVDHLLPASIESMIEESEKLIDQLIKPATSKTGLPLFDKYIKQTFLDNGLRGGFPTVLNDLNGGKVYYIYSRKHGDMERDYNAFQIPNRYYSSGPGNFRDVNQNRRNDLFFYPFVKDYNIHQFFSLIQIDGHNPLNICPPVFCINDSFDFHLLDTCKEPLKSKIIALTKRYEPSELFTLMMQYKKCFNGDTHDLFSKILSASKQEYAANFAEGYWIDHWTYNVDLIENYVSIYPDEMETLLFKSDYRYFYSPIYIEPRAEKYVLLPDGRVRQYGAIDLNKAKRKAVHQETTLTTTDWLKDVNGNIVQTTLASKLFNLVLIKFATLDSSGIGIEMEAEKPGWNDAMNGLPGLFSSGVSETVELLRLLRITRDLFYKYADRSITMFTEQFNLLKRVKTYLEALFVGEIDQFTYWNFVAEARENFRLYVQDGIQGTYELVRLDELVKVLNSFENVLNKGLQKAKIIGDGILPSYLSYQVKDFELTGHTNHLGYPTVRVKSFEILPIPAFLEASARAYKLHDQLLRHDDHQRIQASDLYDHHLHFYKTSVDLTHASFEIGRVRAFTKGWLERECNFLHMSYKYLLGLLRAGLYEDFYKEIKTNLVMFMDPAVYGRNPIENSSFIVPTCNPDRSFHGQGFFARLTGANAEMLDIYIRMFAGDHIFIEDSGVLKFNLQPVLSNEFFDENNQVQFTLFGNVQITYENPERLNCYQPYKITYQVNNCDYAEITGSLALAIRQGKISNIKAIIRSTSK
jgi:hypothetical protein